VNDPDPLMVDDFDCSAYGPGSRELGAVCFFGGELNLRACPSLAACHEAMAAERRRVWQRIQDGAARGEPDMVHLAAEFTSAEQLLGGVLPEEGDGGDDDR
jgi:hypothetical protein